MRIILSVLFVSLLLGFSCKEKAETADKPNEDTTITKLNDTEIEVIDPSAKPPVDITPEFITQYSYLIGMEIGFGLNSLRFQQADIDLLIQGIKDTYDGNPKYSREELDRIQQEHALYMDELQKIIEKGDTLKDFPPKMKPKLVKEVSYMLGAERAGQMVNDSLIINYDSFKEAIVDKINLKEPKYPQEELDTLFEKFQTMIGQNKKKQHEARIKLAEENLKKADEFFAENKTKEGIKISPTDIQYKILATGDSRGRNPKLEESVSINILGKHLDGTIFDDTRKKFKKPLQLPLAQTLPIFKEIITLMKPGDRWAVYAPPAKALSDRGAEPDFIPNEVLIFEIELISIDGLSKDIQPDMPPPPGKGGTMPPGAPLPPVTPH